MKKIQREAEENKEQIVWMNNGHKLMMFWQRLFMSVIVNGVLFLAFTPRLLIHTTFEGHNVRDILIVEIYTAFKIHVQETAREKSLVEKCVQSSSSSPCDMYFSSLPYCVYLFPYCTTLLYSWVKGRLQCTYKMPPNSSTLQCSWVKWRLQCTYQTHVLPTASSLTWANNASKICFPVDGTPSYTDTSINIYLKYCYCTWGGR